MNLKPSQLTPAIFALLFVSGASALIYQVVWARLFAEIFGSTTFAVSAVLAAFMSGLALGSFLLGRIADRSRNPLRLYGFYEIGIGLAALAVLFIFNGLTPVYLWLYAAAGDSLALLSTGRFVVAFALIIVPTTLMGATLPVLTRFATDRIERLGANVAGLYAINTAGAITGSLLAGFVMIRLLGMTPTVFIAVAINVAAGLVAVWLARTAGDQDAASVPDTRQAKKTDAVTSRDHRVILWVLAISGFTAFAFEIYWTRALILVVGSSTYAFTTILCAFLTGIALGGWAIRLLLDRIRQPMLVFGAIEIGIGVTAALTIPFVVTLTDTNLLLRFIDDLENQWDQVLALRFVTSFLIMLVPTVLIGATFPLVARIYATELERTGTDVGRVYAVNTLGNIAGAIIPAFVILPLIGIGRGILLMAVLNVAAGTIVLLNTRTLPARLRIAVPAFVAILALGAILAPAGLQFVTTNLATHRLLFYEEGIAATTEVVASRADPGDKSILVDGSGIGGTGVVDEKQQMLAHLPALLHPEARSFLSIGLGSGILIGEAALHEQFERLKVVEIAPSVVAGSRFFTPENHAITDNPKITIEINDGVNYLLTTGETYDVIASDAKTRPEYGSNGVFYSADYYALARMRLNPGGLFMQWIPLYLPAEDYATVLRTMADAFPHATLWYVAPGNSYLVGSETPLAIDYASVDARLRDLGEPFGGLRKYGITRGYELLSHYVTDERVIGPAVGDAPVNSLEHPVIEFYALRDYAVSEVDRRLQNIALLLELRGADTGGVPVVKLSRDERARLDAARAAEDLFIQGFRRVMATGPAQYDTVRTFFDEAINLSPANNDLRYHVMENLSSLTQFALRTNNAADAERFAREATLVSPLAGEANCIYGEFLLKRGQLERSIQKLEACVERKPTLIAARQMLAGLYAQTGRNQQAIEQQRVLEKLRLPF